VPDPATTVDARLGDWLELAPRLEPSSIDLLYADPPFNTGRTQRARAGAFDDRFDSAHAWTAWLRARLEATLPALRTIANILIHCDWRTCHHARLLLDDLLGPERFVNHLIWSYGLGGSSRRRFARKHDDILFVTLDPHASFFDPPMVPSTSRRMNGAPKKATDVLDIPAINNMARERTGWPTQKPVALLELLVGACCPPGGVVLDPCCGSGTTLVAAHALGRHAIGFDIDADAITLARTRLATPHHAPRARAVGETPSDRR
jgi:site-specific DNA-methyltransferase (adenine-specific)